MLIKDWLFPPRCPYCNRVISAKEWACEVCRKKIIIEYAEVLLYKSHCTAPFYYKDPVKSAILKFKFGNRPDLGIQLAMCMKDAIERQYKQPFDWVACVPLTKRKTRKRGYNQAEVLAKQLGKQMRLSYKPLLTKVVDNRPQHKLHKKDRQKNVHGVYAVNKKFDVNGKHVLLIDDICTTGATLSECAYTLKQAGAASVYCAAFAIVK